MATPVIMPKQGQSVESCVIGKWHKKKGERVSAGDILFTYETDKATFDEEAKAEGVLLEVFFEEGDEVDCLKTVCVIGLEGESADEFRTAGAPERGDGGAGTNPEAKGPQAGGGAATSAQIAASAQAETAPATDSAPTPATDSSSMPGETPISPRARALARITGADLGRAVPTGAKGRIIEEDVKRLVEQGFLATRAALGKQEDISGISGTGLGGRVATHDVQARTAGSAPSYAAAGGPDFTEVKVSGIRKVIAKAMHASLADSAQLTLHSSFDAGDVLNLRKKLKSLEGYENLGKITITDIIVYAASRVLPKHKGMNAHFLGEKMALYDNAHIGVAVDTPRGLLVPTLFNANALTLKELSEQAKAIFEKCKKGNIEPDMLKGGTFTVSNLGALGIEMFTPVLNPPQTGLLGICSIVERTRDGGKPYPAMGLSLTFDHRALDGADAARFLKELVGYLENFSMYIAIEGGLV